MKQAQVTLSLRSNGTRQGLELGMSQKSLYETTFAAIVVK
jgi:hypothetical protein